MCTTKPLCCRAEISTTLQINYTSMKKKQRIKNHSRMQVEELL